MECYLVRTKQNKGWKGKEKIKDLSIFLNKDEWEGEILTFLNIKVGTPCLETTKIYN